MRPDKIGTGSALFSCQRAATFPPWKREERKVYNGLRFFLKTAARKPYVLYAEQNDMSS
jgi:hypothetical protein